MNTTETPESNGSNLAWNAWLDAMTMTRERCASIAENHDLGTPEGHAIAGCIRGA